MKPEGSLPNSRVANTCPYPESPRSIPCPTSHLLQILHYITLPSTPVSSKWHLTFMFSQRTLYTPLLSPYVLHALPTSFLSISSPNSYLLISTVHNAHQYVVFSSPMFPFPLMPTYSLQHTIIHYPNPMFLSKYERPSFTHVQNDRQNYIYSCITSGGILCRYTWVLF